MKIPLKAFLLSAFYSAVSAAVSYFALMPLCRSFAPFLIPFVLIISISVFIVLFYLSAAHYKTFSAKIDGGRLAVSKGFLIRRKIRLSLEFTVSVKQLTTPLMRLLGLSSLLLIFEGSVCVLPLLKSADAEEIFGVIIEIRDKNEKI